MKIKIFEGEKGGQKFHIIEDDSCFISGTADNIPDLILEIRRIIGKALNEKSAVMIVFPTSRIIHRPSGNPVLYREVRAEDQAKFWEDYS
jgi:hypothetical protein